MEINSFVINPYRDDYLEKLNQTRIHGLKGVPNLRKIRFCQPEPVCFQCMCKPVHIPEPHIHAALSGIQTQLSGADGTTIANGAPVLFNAIVNNPSPDIEYTAATGEFIIRKPGNYIVSWWVNTDGAGTAGFAIFSVVVANGQFISASSPFPQTTLQLNGIALLTINTTMIPAHVRLLNTSGDIVTYGVSAIQANMAIVEVTNLPLRP